MRRPRDRGEGCFRSIRAPSNQCFSVYLCSTLKTFLNREISVAINSVVVFVLSYSLLFRLFIKKIDSQCMMTDFLSPPGYKCALTDVK